jgi:hypothetical protein
MTEIRIQYGEVVVHEGLTTPYMVDRFLADHGMNTEDADHERHQQRRNIVVPEDKSLQPVRIRTLVISQTRLGLRSTSVPNAPYKKKDDPGDYTRDHENVQFQLSERGIAHEWLSRVFDTGIRL